MIEILAYALVAVVGPIIAVISGLIAFPLAMTLGRMGGRFVGPVIASCVGSFVAGWLAINGFIWVGMTPGIGVLVTLGIVTLLYDFIRVQTRGLGEVVPLVGNLFGLVVVGFVLLGS